MNKKISFIILTWNSEKTIDMCLKGIEKKCLEDKIDYEVIIVDNRSNYKEIRDLNIFMKNIGHYNNFDIKLFYDSANRGYAYGMNQGIKKSSGDLILISNTDIDIYFNHTFLKDAVKFMEENNCDIMDPKIYYTNTGKVWSSGGFFDFTNYRNQEIKNKKVYDITEVDYVSGCCMFVRRDVFKKIKLFDENYFMYWEDSDFCYRAKQNGFKIIYNPRITISHNINEEKERESEFVKVNYFRSKFLFIFKHFPLKLLIYCLPATVFITLVVFLKSKIKNRLIKGLKVIINGIVLGLKVRSF